jgi:hypothetical protein
LFGQYGISELFRQYGIFCFSFYCSIILFPYILNYHN